MSDFAKKIVKHMWNNDPFCELLGIEIVFIKKGYCKIKMKITAQMLNSQKIAHGAISYTLADTALAYASNSHGKKSVSLETSITHINPVRENDIITATTEEFSITNKTGVYNVIVKNQENETIALLKGVVYRSEKLWKEIIKP